MKRFLTVLILVSILCLFSSCATLSLNSSKTVSGEHPANLDLNGAKSITVMPFSVDSKTKLSNQNDSADARKAADYIRECLVSELEKSKTLKYKNSGADITISGKILQYIVETEKASSASGYVRSVVTAVEYEVFNTKSRTLIATKNASVSAESKPSGASKRLPKAYVLIEPKLPRISTVILQDVQPYTVVNRISLIKSKKNRAMRKAYKLFAKGEYTASKQAYLDIYRQTELFEAGYNAVRLMQIKGELENAKALSSELFTRFKDTRAANVLHEIESQLILKTE